MKINTRALLVSTALTLPMAGGATAQQIEINPDQLVDKVQECQDLGQLIADNDGEVGDLASVDVVTAINEDDAELCATYVEDLQIAFGIEAEVEAEVEAEADVQVSEEVHAVEEIDIEAEAQASVPAPTVAVQVPGSAVTVTPGTSSVDVERGALVVDVEQPQPTVAVEIPEIVVRVAIPAPNVYVLQSDPSISVTQSDPQIEVEQGEPLVEVTQPDPEVTIALGEDAIDGDGLGDATEVPVEEIDAGENQAVDGEIMTSVGEPTVEIVQGDQEPEVVFSEVGVPEVSYIGAEPEVGIEFAQEPTIEIIQSGQPQVVFETIEEREQRLAQQ